MAAGRHGVSSRRGLYTSFQDKNDSYRNGCAPKSTMGPVRHASGYRHSSGKGIMGGNHVSNQQSRFSILAKDQELSQLQSRSRVVNVAVYGSHVECGEIVNSVTEVHQVSLEKKRKFSPIEWQREEKRVKTSSQNQIIPRPSMPQAISVVSDGSVDVYRLTCDQLQTKEASSIKSSVDCGSGESDVTECSPYSSAQLPQMKIVGDVQVGEKTDEVEFEETWNILTSRWASDDSVIDSGGSDDEDIAKGNQLAGDVSEQMLDMQRMSSPESGEFVAEDEYYEDNSKTDIEVENQHKTNAFHGQSESLSEQDNDTDSNQQDLVHKRSTNMLQSSRSVFDYEKLNKINEGTYGIVYRAREKDSGEIVALKKIKMGLERDGGFPLSSLREINILLSLHHPSIVNVKEVVMGDLDSVFMVMEYMEHDLKGMIDVMKQPFSSSEVKCLMLQLLEGLKHLHDNWVLHRDLKSSNLLLNNKGELKICDFGMSRQYGSPFNPYTPLVVTLWYRAPEILLGTKQYSTAIDMWSVGCIMAEMLCKEPLFQGKSEIDQLDKIFKTLGTPNENIWPGFSKLPGSNAKFVNQTYNQLRKKFPAASFTGSPVLTESGFDLLSKLLTFNPEERITVDAALNHAWFREIPLPKHKDFMPTFPPQSERDRCQKK